MLARRTAGNIPQVAELEQSVIMDAKISSLIPVVAPSLMDSTAKTIVYGVLQKGSHATVEINTRGCAWLSQFNQVSAYSWCLAATVSIGKMLLSVFFRSQHSSERRLYGTSSRALSCSSPPFVI